MIDTYQVVDYVPLMDIGQDGGWGKLLVEAGAKAGSNNAKSFISMQRW